jgi:hypothetical protein
MIDGLTLDVAGRAVAAALLHSVWQGALAAGLAALAVRMLRGASAQARYAVACAALAGLVGAFAITAARTASAATNVEGGLQTALTQINRRREGRARGAQSGRRAAVRHQRDPP